MTKAASKAANVLPLVTPLPSKVIKPTSLNVPLRRTSWERVIAPADTSPRS